MSNLNKSHSGATPSASGAIFLHRLGRASRGVALTAAFLTAIGNSLAQAQSYVPAPGYTWEEGARGKFHIGQDSFECPQPMLNIFGFGADGDGWNNNSNWKNSAPAPELTRARGNLGGSGFGGAVGLSIPLSGSIGRDCKEMAKQFLDERRLNTAVSKFRNCVYLKQTGIDFEKLLDRLKRQETSMNPQQKAELSVLSQCNYLGITFLPEKDKVENVEVEETEKKTGGIQKPYEDPGPISGAATKARPLDMSGFGYYQLPVQRYRNID